MITVLYGDPGVIKSHEIEMYLSILPGTMRTDVMRYKFITDQKARLLARLMLHRCMENDGQAQLIHDWKRNSYNKPYIDGWDSFNISYSDEIVAFSRSKRVIGVDIEKKTDIDYRGVLESFHPLEQEFVAKANDINKAFYDVWVKKEAFLKAVGIGITNGLNHFTCLHEKLVYQGVCWYFYPLEINPGYSSYICSQNKEDQIEIIEFNL